jgi:endoglucanase
MSPLIHGILLVIRLLAICLLPAGLNAFPLEIVPRIDNPDQFLLSWPSQTGKTYTVQSATDLQDGFSEFAQGQQASMPVNNWWIGKSEVGTVRFFRVQEVLPDLGFSERRAAHELNRRLYRGNNFMASKAIQGEGAPEDYALMRESGFNHVRIGYKLDEFVSSVDNYQIPVTHLQEIQRLVDACLAEGLIAIIDPVHNWANGPGYTDNEADRTKLRRIWEQVAAWFADYDLENVVYEIMNEPHDNAAQNDVDNVAKIIEIGLTAIRGAPGNEERIVIVCGDGFSTRQALIDSLDNGDIPGDDPYLIGTFHYYDPRPFTKQGDSPETLSWGSNAEFLETETKFDEVVAANNRFATRNNTEPLPIYLGEFGVDNAAPEADRTRWLSWIRMQAEARDFSWAHWNMYRNSASAKGMGPWTSTEKDDPTKRRFDPAPLEALVGFYEFEDGSRGGGVASSSDEPGYSGSGYAAFPQATGVAVWARADSLYIPKTDTYVAKIHYASAVDRTVRVVTGGQTLTGVVFPSTGGDDSWATLEVVVQFNASSGHDSGTESLKIVADPDPGPHLDWVHITRP